MFIASIFSNYLDQANCTTLSSKVTMGTETSLKNSKMGKYSESGG